MAEEEEAMAAAVTLEEEVEVMVAILEAEATEEVVPGEAAKIKEEIILGTKIKEVVMEAEDKEAAMVVEVCVFLTRLFFHSFIFESLTVHSSENRG